MAAGAGDKNPAVSKLTEPNQMCGWKQEGAFSRLSASAASYVLLEFQMNIYERTVNSSFRSSLP